MVDLNKSILSTNRNVLKDLSYKKKKKQRENIYLRQETVKTKAHELFKADLAVNGAHAETAV